MAFTCTDIGTRQDIIKENAWSSSGCTSQKTKQATSNLIYKQADPYRAQFSPWRLWIFLQLPHRLHHDYLITTRTGNVIYNHVYVCCTSFCIIIRPCKVKVLFVVPARTYINSPVSTFDIEILTGWRHQIITNYLIINHSGGVAPL